MLTKQEFRRIKNYIVDDLKEDYGIDEMTANKMIDKVNFDKIRTVSPDLLCHYGSEYWAKKIYRVYNNLQLTLV